MGKEEPCGIPDPISIAFSRRVREALKQREEDRQPPRTSADLARAIGIENNQISNLNRYVNIGVSVSGYTHWRPDWMLRAAQILEIPLDFKAKERNPLPEGGTSWMTATSAADSSVKLRVGLASDYPDLFEIAFEIYAACANARAREQGGQFSHRYRQTGKPRQGSRQVPC
jgi:hypothetical protein